MKKNYYVKAIFFFLAFVMSYAAQGQILFTSTPDSTAVLNELYSYQVTVTANPPAVTYALDEKPAGMTIEASTGLITWTPTNIYQGGKVVVKVTNTWGNNYQTFYVYITDAIACPNGLNSYWNLDVKNGTTIPDNANGYDAEFVGLSTNEPYIVPGKVGNGLSFEPASKTSAFYEVADQDQYDWKYTNDFTISLWFKNRPSPLPAPDVETLIARSPSPGNPASWRLQWNNSNSWIGLYIKDGSGTDTVAWRTKTVADTLWHHAVVVVYGNHPDSSLLTVYVDNTNQRTWKTFGTTRFDNITPVTIGYMAEYAASNTFPFSGYMDEIAIFNRGLFNAGVDSLYKKGLAGKPICQEGNFIPIITSTPLTSVTEDEAYSYTLTGRDAEGSTLTKTATVKPSWLTFNATTGLLSGTPLNDDTGDTTVTLTISDGSSVVTQTFTLTVVNVNDPPIITSTAPTQVNEDVEYSYTFVANDIDKNDTVTLSAPQLPSWMTFDAETGLLSGTPTNDQVGTDASRDYNITLRATDNLGLSTDQSIVLTVTNINDEPVINSQNTITINEDVSREIALGDLDVTDVDDVYPDDFVLTVKTGNNYTFAGNILTPALNWSGVLTVPVDLSDGEATLAYDMTVTVTAVNDTPAFTSTPVEFVNVGELYQYWISTSDVEGQAVTISCPVKPAWLTFSQNAGTGLLQGTPTIDDAGDANVTLEITDGTAKRQQIFVIEVIPDNYAPEITSTPDITAVFDQVYTYVITATDRDGDPLTYSGKVVPSWLVFNASTHTLSGIPVLADEGDHNVTLSVTDGTEVVDQSFVINVSDGTGIDIRNADIARIYPIPASDFVTFEFASVLDNATLEVFSIKGERITMVEISGTRSLQLDITNFRPNQYLYRIISSAGTQNGIFLVQ